MLVPFFHACKPIYSTVSFQEVNKPKAPNYSKAESWAVLPGRYPASLQSFIGSAIPPKGVDVFYVYPTLFTDPKEKAWNADVYSQTVRKNIIETAVKYQASAWAKSGRLFVPYYRQTHYRVFVPPHDKKGLPAWEVSYSDIKDAFTYYLEHYNQGNGIIIAAHSQGSMHSTRLIKEFFDGTALQKQLVAAYLVGSHVAPNEFETILAMEKPDETGGFVSWNTYKNKQLPKNYSDWYQGGVTSNPIRWDNSDFAYESEHKGVLFRNLKIYPKSLSIYKTDGMLWSTLPKVPSRFFLSFVRSYHFADINLFWEDISLNAQLRAKKWLKKNGSSDAL